MEKELTRQEQEERFIEVYNKTGKQSEAMKILGWDKSKASRFMKKIRETEPERLQAPQKPRRGTKQMQAGKTMLDKEKAQEKANTKPQKGTMGFRANLSEIDFWRIYADATDTELSAMCTNAINEYIQRHEPTAKQRKIIDIRMKALEEEKRVREEK